MTNIKLFVMDIASAQVDVIVNSANASLRHGSGISHAIHKASGCALEEECVGILQKLGLSELPAGEVIITSAYSLPAKHVIHAVGPKYGQEGGRESELLTRVYIRSLDLAIENHAKSIAFPSISTGMYGFPKNEAAQLAVSAVRDFIERNPGRLEEIHFFFANEEHRHLFARLLENE